MTSAPVETDDELLLRMQSGDEEAFVALVKSADPDIKPEKLLELIRLFREQRRSSALGGSKPS